MLYAVDTSQDPHSQDHDELEGWTDWVKSTGESIYNTGKAAVKAVTGAACDGVRSGIVQQASGYAQYAPNPEAQSAGQAIQYGAAACNAVYPPDMPPLPIPPSGNNTTSALVARATFATPPIPRYPAGSIAALDPKIGKYRLAIPAGSSLKGAGLGASPYNVVGTSATVPAGVKVVPLTELQKETGTLPWYKNWKTYAIAGGVVATGTGAYMLLR